MSYYPYSNNLIERDGANSKDVWAIYNRLPYNTNFTLEFYYYGEDGEPLERINFMKCGNPLEPETIEDHIRHMKDAFRRWGYSGYRSLLMMWNRGFGNSVILQVILYRPEQT